MKKRLSTIFLALIIFASCFSQIVQASEERIAKHETTIISGKENAAPASKGGILSAQASGWVKRNGKYYFYDTYDGMLKRGIYYVYNDGKYYAFRADGTLVTGGWNYIEVKQYGGSYSKEWVYASSGGKLLRGWQRLGGKWYYFNTSCPYALRNGIYSVDGKYYYFDSKCVMRIGWIKAGGKWYFANSSGVLATGWKKINNVWYYFDTGSREMLANDGYVINGKGYYFAANGALRTGWIKDGSDWLFANSSGTLLKGWQKINNKWYYFYNSNTYPYMYSDGVYTINGKHYAFNGTGELIIGSFTYYGTVYRTDSSGAIFNW